MSRLFVAVLGALLMVAAGCESSSSKQDGGSGAKMMSTDACPACPGVQKANANGKCDMCEAKKSGTSSAAGADACSHCAGVQTASADGKCPACGMALAK